MKRLNRLTIFAVIILGVLILITLFAAPSSSRLNNGSTYNRAPEGYAAWYSYMQRRGKIERWQRSTRDLKPQKDLVTFVQVIPSPEIRVSSEDSLYSWIEKGNNLIILDVAGKATPAEFTTVHKSNTGNIKIDTTKRYQVSRQISKLEQNSEAKIEVLLSDANGAIVWQVKYSKGKVIYAVTPHLAANAYQNEPGNFEFLSQLASDNGKRKIYIDEYIHGYKDQDIKDTEGKGDVFAYLRQKPLFAAFIQVGVVLLVLVFSQNRRFGKSSFLVTPIVDNSQAYIQALAAVLQKADSSDFVLEMVGKEELNQLKRRLGVGQNSDSDELLSVWDNKIGTESDLKSALSVQSQQEQSQKRRLSEKDLIAWLRKWGNIRKFNV
jgi:hypothetical protein